MEKFTKSILNYFTTYTETRFRFDTKIGYKWTDDIFTAEFSVFPDFQKKILSAIKDKGALDVSVKKGEYSVSIDESREKFLNRKNLTIKEYLSENFGLFCKLPFDLAQEKQLTMLNKMDMHQCKAFYEVHENKFDKVKTILDT